MELTTAVRSPTDPAVPAVGDASDPSPRSLKPHLRLIPRRYVRRPRMIDRLSTGAPITLVVGPAGTGKTVAVAGWAAEHDDPVAWVNVLTATGAVDGFWPTIAEALGVRLTVAEADSNDAGKLLAGDAVLALVATLEETLERDVVLVIDNYHVAEGADLAASTALFLRHLPDRLRVIIVSRRVPLLPLDRIRVTGDLCEIDADDLQFSRADADQLLEMVAPTLQPRVADTIISASDGWVAALRLGTNAWLAGGREPSVPGVTIEHDDAVALQFGDLDTRLDHFVMHEVLGEESDDLVEFLSDIAVVHQASIGLAEAIADRGDAGELLDLAHCRGLFVSHGGVRRQYAIHPVVRRAVLTARERRDPTRKMACHARAAEWLERSDEVIGALEQWLQAGDHANALRLLSRRHVQLYEAGREPMVREVLAKLSPEATSRDVSSLIDLAWCQMLTDLPSFRENLEHAVWWSEHGGAVDADGARRLLALRGIAGLAHGDWQLAERESRAALDGHPAWHDDEILRTTWNDVARAIALSERWDDGADEVRELNVVLRRDRTRTLVLEATRALGLALAGCPVDALRVAGGVRTSTTLANLTVSSVELDCAEVIARRELGDAPDAAADLERLLTLDLGPQTYVRGLAAAELVQLHLDRGSVSDAAQAFCRLERVVTEEVRGPGGQAWLGRMGTILSIESGDHVQAAHWANAVEDPFWGPVSRARVLAATGGHAELVSATLDDAVARSPRHALIQAMLRASTAADPESAATWVESAVQIASANNMLQTIAAEGQVELIERIAWRLPSEWMDRLRRATAVGHSVVTADPSLLEPLTVRERDVLRFLPSRLTLAEIAGELYVSVNTLKFHLKVIYRKLGVNSRAEAAEIARSWGRIDQR